MVVGLEMGYLQSIFAYLQIAGNFLVSAGGAAIIAGLFKFWLDKQSHRNRIKEIMTGKMIDYNEKYYLPLSTEMEGLRWSLKQGARKSGREQNAHCFFYLARYFSRRVQSQKFLSGYILRDIHLERALMLLETQIFDEIVGPSGFLSPFDMATLVKHTSPDESFDDFHSKLSVSPMSRLFSQYGDWREKQMRKAPGQNKCRELALYASCYTNILDYAVSSALKEGWYRKVPGPFWEEDEPKDVSTNILPQILAARELDKYRKKLRLPRIKQDPRMGRTTNKC
jgi:hypothetical protein